jgi:glutathione S-transferase
MTEPLVLYDAVGSPCARRVRIVLIEKGLHWETRALDLTRLEQKRPEYLQLNPNGVVPTLVHGERVIYESNVITEYLDEAFPGTRLYPADPYARAQAKMWQAFELAMAKEYRPLMYLRLIGPYDRLRPKEDVMADARRSTDDAAHLDWVSRVYDGTALTEDEARHLGSLLLQRLDHLERTLAGRRFLVGDDFSIADVSVLPRVAMYPLVGLAIDPARHGAVLGWLERLAERRSFVESEQLQPSR